MDSDNLFGDLAPLARALFAAIGGDGNDGSHDRTHIMRVWANAAAIAAAEGGCDTAVLLAATVLHDCVAVEKSSPLRPMASRMAAERARGVLALMGWEPGRVDAVAHAIEAHSYSAGIEPLTAEARVLQDADRLDAIGAIGVARCFYIAGRLGSGLYSADDPAGERRALDDQRFALDHFKVKLFKLADGFRTDAGRAMAQRRAAVMRGFVDTLLGEIG
jgi:uncharacterized protein